MKKKLVSILALSLCFVMSAGAFAGCKGGDDSSSSGGSNPLTEEEIFAKVMEGIDATAAYKGGFTYTLSVAETEEQVSAPADPEQDGVASYASMTTISADPATKKFVLKQSVEEKDANEAEPVSRIGIQKLFKEGDNYYVFTTVTDTGNPDYNYESHVQYSEFLAGAFMDDYTLKNFSFSSEIMPTSLTSVANYNAAWASYIADSKAELVAGSTDEDSDWYGHSGDGSYLLSAAEVDGGYEVRAKMTYSLTDEDDDTEILSCEIVCTVKNGKLVSLLEKEEYMNTWYEADGEYASKDDEGAQLQKYKEMQESSITLSYEFNQAEYDSISTTLPQDVPVQPDSIQKRVKLVVNGIDCGTKYAYGDTVAEALEYITDERLDTVYYTDAACTQLVNQEVTGMDPYLVMAQFYQLDTLYAVATAKTGYVLYTYETQHTFAADVPEYYKTVLAEYFDDNKKVKVCSADQGFSISNGLDYKDTFVNGVEVDFGNNSAIWYPVEEGQTYEVKEVYEESKADLNFFDMNG